MPFAAVARLVNPSWHRVAAICQRYVELALDQADFSEVERLAVDETSRARGHDCITLFADAGERKVRFVAEGRRADAVETFANDLAAHGGTPEASESLPNARHTFDEFRVVAHAGTAVDETRRIEQRPDPSLEGLRWARLEDRSNLDPDAQADLYALVAQLTARRTALAWLYREQLRDIPERKQIDVVRGMLIQWCTNVMRSKVEPA